MSQVVPDNVGFAVERAFRVWHALHGVPLVACTEQSGRNHADRCAPTIFLPRSEFLLLPDFIQVGAFRALEIKTRSHAPYFMSANCHTTGMMPSDEGAPGAKGAWYLWQYQQFERVAQMPVHLLFVHLGENEIRGGSLQEIEPARTARVNLYEQNAFWEYDKLPCWPIAPTELFDEALAGSSTLDRKAAAYFTATDRQLIAAYTKDTALPCAAAYTAKWKTTVEHHPVEG